MPRKPTIPCAGGCGRLTWGHPTSLGAGKQMCRPCRKTSIARPTPGPDATCINCAKPFRSVRRGDGQRTRACSWACSNAVAPRPGLDVNKRRASWRNRNHRRRQAVALTSDITTTFEAALRAAAKRCPICDVHLVDEPKLPASKELDHIVPLNVGGTHTIGNVRIICRTCNRGRPWDGSDYTGPVTLWSQIALPRIAQPQRLAHAPTSPPIVVPNVSVCRRCCTLLVCGWCSRCDPPKDDGRDWEVLPARGLTPEQRRWRGRRAALLRESGATWWEVARELRFPGPAGAYQAAKAHRSLSVT